MVFMFVSSLVSERYCINQSQFIVQNSVASRVRFLNIP